MGTSLNIRLCAILFAALGLTACEGMEASQYADIDDDPQMQAINSSIPHLPPQPGIASAPKSPVTEAPVTPAPPATGGPSRMPKPPTAPTPPATGGTSQMPKPPQASPPAPPRPVGCSPPSISIRKEANGAVEINCGTPPMAPPAGLQCTSPEALTWLTRNGTSSFVCMK
ncbi:MAG: hypothetical protein QM773_15785 [Hyphomonadaceae bacterium]